MSRFTRRSFLGTALAGSLLIATMTSAFLTNSAMPMDTLTVTKTFAVK